MLYINSNKKNEILNENIKAKEIRLVGEEDSRIISTREALEIARQKELDLVMVSPNANPPVCKIMNYSKFVYEQTRKLKEAKKNQKVVVLKEIRLSATIEENDIDIKAKRARGFLEKGDKVKVTVRFKGRQNAYTDMGKKVLDIFLEKIGEVGSVEKAPILEGKNLFTILAPSKKE